MDDWEEDLLKRYPDPEMTKEKKDYRNYNDSDREDTVREFYKRIINTKPMILLPLKRRNFSF